MRNLIPTNYQGASLRGHLIRSTFGSFVLKLTQTAAGFLLSVFLARGLGTEGYGTYSFCISMVTLLSIPAMLGGQNLLVREVASYCARGEFSFLRGLLIRIRQASLVSSFLIAFCAALAAYLILDAGPLRAILPFAFCLVPLLSAMNLQNAALRGLHHVLLGQISFSLMPLLFIAIITILDLGTNFILTPNNAVWIHAGTLLLLVLWIGRLLHLHLPKEVTHRVPAYETRKWIKSLLPFLFTGMMQTCNNEASVILLGIIQNTDSVGLFRVAQRGSDLVLFALLSINMAIAPTISDLYAKGEKDRLQNIITKSTLLVAVFALLTSLTLVFMGKWLVPFIFGEEYAPAYAPLAVLCLGQLFNACMGSVGLILNMIGMENLVTRGITIAAISNLLLNAILIPQWGPTGAALANSIALLVWNTLLATWLYKKSGIVSFVVLPRFKTKISRLFL